jgi:hypothetical protein
MLLALVERREFVLELARTWYSDDNAVFRQRLSAEGRRRGPLLVQILAQGVAGKAFTVDDAEQTARIIMSKRVRCLDRCGGDRECGRDRTRARPTAGAAVRPLARGAVGLVRSPGSQSRLARWARSASPIPRAASS